MRKVLITLCAGMMLLAGVTAAKADEVLVIDKWDYAVDGIFTTWKDEDGRTGTVYNAGQANRPWPGTSTAGISCCRIKAAPARTVPCART